jgi:hypothetical protein
MRKSGSLAHQLHHLYMLLGDCQNGTLGVRPCCILQSEMEQGCSLFYNLQFETG